MYFTKGKQRAFELLMQQKPGFDRYQSGCAGDDEDCGTCRFYRPGWKYEFCVFKECPYCPGKRTRKTQDRKSTRLNSSHRGESRMPSSA